MSTPSDFRIVMRGYEPAQVDSRMRGLEEEIARLRADQPKLRASAPPTDPASYEHLGRRMMQILDLATEEAEALREAARTDAATARFDAIADAELLAEQAELEAEQIRADAQAEVARTAQEARQAATDALDAAAREAAARRREAHSLLERQRAAVVEANDEFERTLAERRETADRTFRETEAGYRERLDALGRQIASQHAEGEAIRSQARQDARRILEDAQAHAAELMEQTRASTVRLRADADREIAAATQRRDGLNQELADLRSMLASLTASARERGHVPVS